MIWSPQQERALTQVSRWQTTGDKPYFTLAGYAGTGKTTLAKYLAAGAVGSVYFAAYTGKAAHVLMKTGVENASTIHKLIYKPINKSGTTLAELKKERADLLLIYGSDRSRSRLATLNKAIKVEQENLSRPDFKLNSDSPLLFASLLVIDEYSMVDRQTGADLLSFGCPILALGDPGQLPPVQGDRFFDQVPDVMLDEIHRQAADNPIIRMSKDVREGKVLLPGIYGSSRVVRQRDVSDDELARMVLNTGQFLVGMNVTRRQFNGYARQLHGRRGKSPVEGDKLVCLRNNHDDGLLNGQIWIVRGVRNDEGLTTVA